MRFWRLVAALALGADCGFNVKATGQTGIASKQAGILDKGGGTPFLWLASARTLGIRQELKGLGDI